MTTGRQTHYIRAVFAVLRGPVSDTRTTSEDRCCSVGEESMDRLEEGSEPRCLAEEVAVGGQMVRGAQMRVARRSAVGRAGPGRGSACRGGHRSTQLNAYSLFSSPLPFSVRLTTLLLLPTRRHPDTPTSYQGRPCLSFCLRLPVSFLFLGKFACATNFCETFPELRF